VADAPAGLIHPAQALAAQWAAYLQHDRRRSAHTVRAYVATAHRLIQFLGRYRGEEIGPAGLLDLSAADLRAFLADRRGEGLGASSAARELSGVRAFLTYAAERQGRQAQLPRTRAPRRPRTLPRPASPDEAMELAENAAEAASVPWIGARDLAILLLLYGAGLRVAEALSLTAAALPIGSVSTRRTRYPASPRLAATFTAEAVLPTPPFWLAKRMRRTSGEGALALQGGVPVFVAFVGPPGTAVWVNEFITPPFLSNRLL